MKIGPSFVTLAGSAMLVLSVSPAQARTGQSQASAAQMRDVKSAALWYPAGADYFNKQYQALAKQFLTTHQIGTAHHSTSSMSAQTLQALEAQWKVEARGYAVMKAQAQAAQASTSSRSAQTLQAIKAEFKAEEQFIKARAQGMM
jgi:hypothetical protein